MNQRVLRAGSTLAILVIGAGASYPPRMAVSVSGQVTIQERDGEVTEDIGDVVVFLEPTGPAKTKAMSPTKTVITLKSRQFSPRVRVIPEGSKVEFPNEDPFSHNVFSKMNGGFDTGVYGRGKTKDQTFKEGGVYPIYCNVHPRMTGFIITLNTPYFTQAGGDGRFTLENVPTGTYKLHVWHDRANSVEQDLTVGATGSANLRIQLDARGYKYVQHKNKLGKDYTNAAGDKY
jgi:plastocyanin